MALFQNQICVRVEIIKLFHPSSFTINPSSWQDQIVQTTSLIWTYYSHILQIGWFVCLILYVPSTTFQLNRDRSSWKEQELS